MRQLTIGAAVGSLIHVLMKPRTTVRKLTVAPAMLSIITLGWSALFHPIHLWGDAATDTPATHSKAGSLPQLRVLVDPRIELVSLLFRLAGNPEYNQARVASYTADVEQQFARFKDDPAVELARELRESRGVSYDACMNLAILLTDVHQPSLAVSLEPWPDFLDERWTVEGASNFVGRAQQFVRDSGFEQFIKAHQQLYRTTESRMRDLMDKEGHLEWFHDFFGERAQANFTLALGMLNGGGCYGPHCRDKSGREELFCVLGVWATDAEGVPLFGKDVLPEVVHEFCHSYANPIINRHIRDLAVAGDKLYGPVADRMRSQAYGNAQTMLCESLVRASVVRYEHHYGGPEAGERQIRAELAHGFLWTQELSDLLAQYEAARDRYPTLEAFSPRLVAFFNEYAERFAQEQRATAARRPKVLSIVPVNGATDVDPGLAQIQVVFDRPMRNGRWSLCGGGPNFPELIGKPAYDAQRTTWRVAVKLKPDWEYEFSLNAGEHQSFQSDEGVALAPVPVRFKTGPKPQN